MAHPQNLPNGHPPPPSYDEEPPSYGYNDSVLTYDTTDDMTAPISVNGSRDTATMRLLSPSSDGYTDDRIDDYSADSDVGGMHFSGSQFGVPHRRLYVNSTLESSVPISNPPASFKKDFPEPPSSIKDLEPSHVKHRVSSSSSKTKPAFANKGPFARGSSSTFAASLTPGDCEAKEHPIDPQQKPHVPPSKRPFSTLRMVHEPLMPAPLRLATPKSPVIIRPGFNLDSIGHSGTPSTHNGIGLPSIDKTGLEHAANQLLDRSSVSTARSLRYQPLHHNQSTTSFTPTRPPSSLSNAPSIPPPSVSGNSHRSGSPTRPWSPSQNADWARPPAAASSINYEPPDINGGPRPGTPSSRYGSPQRPLPPAPLFSGPAPVSSVGDTTITIGDDTTACDDPFGGNGRTIDPKPGSRASVRSYDSYLSDSTVVTDKDAMSKIDLDDDGSESNADQNFHYGPAPTGRQDRRGVRQAQMTKKEVKLINGELILECKIPTILHSFLPRRDDREFTHMRYTAVTCDPDDFVPRGYQLRQNIGTTVRETELFVCITMYNEDEINFTRTMHGVMRNISHFCSRTKSRTWGKDGWQKIVVCIIADGRQKVHPRTLNALAAMGVYQDGIAKNIVNQKEVTAHVYEYTTQVSLDSDLKFKGAEKGIVPCQIIFCLKERNQKKLNSHRWFFNAFGRSLNPNVCILLDVGTKPSPTALYHLWKAFDQDSNVAGAAGEIKAGKGKGWLGLLNPLVASQNFEYKMSNILDKPLESVFGYITVLPGALSAYRYHALQNDSTGHGPLSQYFKGEMLHGKNADVFTANMYLAEDRILCWELVAKREDQWILKFVKSAVGETDVPGM